MKKNILLLLTVCSLQLTAFSQSDKFTDAMQKNLSLFDSAKTSEDFVSLANTFERIGDAEKTQWLPYYYAGLALSSAGWQPSTTDKDGNAAKINTLMDRATVNAGNDSMALSEIQGVLNMAATQEMQVDPHTRWMTYGKVAGEALQKGLVLNPNNPRLYYLHGMSLFFTPPQFGGGKDKAKLAFEKAIALFKTEHPKPLYPDWGEKDTERQLALCQ
jgi:hypothetical protein